MAQDEIEMASYENSHELDPFKKIQTKNILQICILLSNLYNLFTAVVERKSLIESVQIQNGGGRREKDLDDEVFGINYAILCFCFCFCFFNWVWVLFWANTSIT